MTGIDHQPFASVFVYTLKTSTDKGLKDAYLRKSVIDGEILADIGTNITVSLYFLILFTPLIKGGLPF